MGRRHVFGLVQLNTSCFDFAPTSQKQEGGLNDEAEIKQGRKAWSTRSTWGILSVLSLPWPLRSPCCCMDVERGELTCAALGKSCACAFCLRAAAQSRQSCYSCCWESTEAGEVAWKKPSEVSFHRDTIFSAGREGQCLSVHTPMGPSSVAGLSEDPGKTGAIPIMATDVGMILSKLGLASHGSCQAVW